MLDRYGLLDATEVAHIVICDKWMASIEDSASKQVKRLTGGLIDRSKVVEDRYAKALPDLTRQVGEHGKMVEDHLSRMGLSG